MASTLNTKSNTLATLANCSIAASGGGGAFSNGYSAVGANGYTAASGYGAAFNSWADSASKIIDVNTTDPALSIKGNLVINGLDLEERLRNIEKILQIPQRDVIMEAKYPSLRKLYDEYIAALGKYRTFETIKGNE